MSYINQPGEVMASAPEDVTLSESGPHGFLPLLVTPRRPCRLIDWVRTHRTWLDAAVVQAGAVLLRGFEMADPVVDFGDVSRAALGELAAYTYRSTPRTSVGDRVYTATEYPPALSIPQHSENAYARSWPQRLAFCCAVPPAAGGQTPLSRNEAVLRRIDPGTVEAFRSRGVLYVRNYHGFVDLPWRTVFGTDRRDEVEAFCQANGIGYEWLPRDALRTEQRCQGTLHHPVHGFELWFNQAHLFHVSAVDSKTHKALTSMFTPESLPRNAFYGDGGELEPAELQAVREAFEAERVCFDWQRADVLLVDNLSVSHGRMSFTGARKVLVAMG